MSEGLRIKSRMHDYQLHFVPDGVASIGDQRKTGAFLVIDQDLPGAVRIKRLFDARRVMLLRANEENKTLQSCAELIQQMVDRDIRRNNVVYAVGGGVVEDVVAFVSTVLFRGVAWVFLPTTLLAQADSCIGSKSSINFRLYKNLLGSFYPPSRIFVDVNFLKTLPPEQVKSGIGGMLHFYLVDGQVKLAKAVMSRYDYFLKNPMALEPFILASLKIKKAMVERDELDKGPRHLFNYGHTFGHAIETVTAYAISHGQAVSMGMDIANYISWRRGHISRDVFESLHNILKSNLPVFRIDKSNWSAYLKALSRDKKNLGRTLGCILTRGPGKMFKTQVPLDLLLKKDILTYFESVC